ncbi:hypothetical protein O6H91_13G010000 [Diphasiastrum complanatum]|uniref:Uncharacterized protein n=1 Tax=Diphasiastrum complanatum TaxID=34168 RepID=A0ACC2BS26_DIPCM|nr:hypothetical protein O6H91_13G010000 [Diphasiastrum complanatum]
MIACGPGKESPDAADGGSVMDVNDGLGFVLGQPPLLQTDMPFNPFRSDRQSLHGVYEVVKTILMLPVFVVRILMMVLCLLLGYVFTKLALLGAKDVLKKPFPKWRRQLFWPVRLLARSLLFSCGFQWISIKGRPVARDQAPILVCNHVTFADPVFIFYQHLPVIVTAQENLGLPIVGAILRAMQVICVNRVVQDSRRIAAGEIKRRARCNDWSSLMIFPEATTTNGKVLVSFKAGAFAPGYPVQPMVVRYPHLHVDPAWVALGASTPLLFFRLLTQFHNFMEVEYLPVIEPTFKEQCFPRAFADRVRLSMAKALNVMITEHSYEDVALTLEALKSKDYSGSAVLEFGKFEKLFRLNIKEAKRYLSKFHQYDTDHKGRATFEDFQSWMELPNCPALQKSFHLFDRPSNGYFNFRQYTLGLAFVSKHSRFKEAIEALYTFCDRDKDGLLGREEIEDSFVDLIPSITKEQVERVWQKIDSNDAHFANKVEFFSFLENHPEYIVVFLFARPNLISISKEEKDRDYVNVNGKLAD